jgi:hypothetical protein
LVGPGGSRQEVALDISKGRLFLVEAKHQSAEKYLISCIPEAISQGIALLKSAKCVSTACSLLHLSIAFQPSRGPFLSI